jgi:hypothetical protein
LHPLPLPADEVLHRPGGLLEQAWAILQAYSDEEIHATQRWLIPKRNVPSIRTSLADVLAKWREYAEAAKREAA